MKIKTCAAIVMCLWVAGCAYLPSVKNKLSIRPVKYVPCWKNMGPNTSCGSVTVPAKEAEGFEVVAGWKIFDDIVDPGNKGNISAEEELSKFADFAENKIVALGYCVVATVPESRNSIMRWEGSGDHGIYVVCAQ